MVYVWDKYFSVYVPEGEEAGRQAEENPCGLANRDTYSCGHIRDTGEENGNPLQYPFLGNPMGKEAWWARVHGVAKCWTQLSDHRTTSMLEIRISVHVWKESESEVAQSCPTLCDPMDCSLPGSSIHGIFQARILEWGAISFSRSCCHFDCHSSCQIRVAEHLSSGWSDLGSFFFFSLKGVSKIYLFLLACWKLAVFGIYFCKTCWQTFPEGTAGLVNSKYS